MAKSTALTEVRAQIAYVTESIERQKLVLETLEKTKHQIEMTLAERKRKKAARIADDSQPEVA